MTTLLPKSLPAEERAIEALEQRITDLSSQAEVEHLWNPWLCPEDFLPVLAWALSVDVWDDDWPVQVKRQVIDSSPYLHEIKGTPLAIKLALASINLDYEYKEWHEHDPPKARGTFDVDVFVSDQGITPALIDNAHALVRANKRGTAKYELTINLGADSTIETASSVQMYVEMDIGLYKPTLSPVDVAYYKASSVQFLAEIEVNPI